MTWAETEEVTGGNVHEKGGRGRTRQTWMERWGRAHGLPASGEQAAGAATEQGGK